MAPSRRSGAGYVLAAGAAAYLLAGSAFVTGGAPQTSFRGSQNAAAAAQEYVAFEDMRVQKQEQPSAWGGVMAALAAFGLLAGVVGAAPQSAMAATTRNVQVVEVVDSSMSVAMKQFTNPSEELDADEQPFEDWSAEHPVQLILTGLIPVFIYLTFYILGSLEVI
eukprot:TRINITY_DN5795_c1_g5_i1.p2 TRINITY_DN5795_c1_g5~~TRINITY_DN5795_c1_g5_i1.p2  ORF type:complete len:165 (+),score=56.24 TRINITY_DN5795_c1_g5_i1:76-570(+)